MITTKQFASAVAKLNDYLQWHYKMKSEDKQIILYAKQMNNIIEEYLNEYNQASRKHSESVKERP